MKRARSLSTSDSNNPFGRIEGLVDVPHLQQRRVTLIGCGSMGCPIATQLARHGVGTGSFGRVRLIDGDLIEARNLIGTEYLHRHIDQPKAEVLASMLREINPQINVSYWNKFLDQGDIPQVEGMAKNSDLLCLFADDFELMLEISEQCYNHCIMVMSLFGPRADTAEVAYSNPGQTPTLKAIMGQRKRKKLSKPQALGCDTGFVADYVAALCLRLLLGEAKGKELFPCYANAPLYLVGLRRTWIFENQPEDVIRSVICVGQSSTP